MGAISEGKSRNFVQVSGTMLAFLVRPGTRVTSAVKAKVTTKGAAPNPFKSKVKTAAALAPAVAAPAPGTAVAATAVASKTQPGLKKKKKKKKNQGVLHDMISSDHNPATHIFERFGGCGPGGKVSKRAAIRCLSEMFGLGDDCTAAAQAERAPAHQPAKPVWAFLTRDRSSGILIWPFSSAVLLDVCVQSITNLLRRALFSALVVPSMLIWAPSAMLCPHLTPRRPAVGPLKARPRSSRFGCRSGTWRFYR